MELSDAPEKIDHGTLRLVAQCLNHYATPDPRLPDDGLVKPKHVAAFIVNLNVGFNILKQFNCAFVGQIKNLITSIFLQFAFRPVYHHQN